VLDGTSLLVGFEGVVVLLVRILVHVEGQCAGSVTDNHLRCTRSGGAGPVLAKRFLCSAWVDPASCQE